MDNILDLPKIYDGFNTTEKTLFNSVYSFSVNTGRAVVPKSMADWVRKRFGSVDAVESQQILRITNKLTLEGTLFNGLRAVRPMHQAQETNLKKLLADTDTEPFADVAGKTPEDEFGRIKGPYDTTASNVAKYDATHGLVIFDNPDPLHFTEEETIGHFDTALKWIAAANKKDPVASYPVIAWNCLWKAGASLVHGHLQVLLAKGAHYPVMELLKKTEDEYRFKYNRSYFDALFSIHSGLSLGTEKDGIQAFAHLTPKKEKEIVLISRNADKKLFSILHRVLSALIKRLKVESFNLVVMMPPLDLSWKGFPVITRIVDRGPLSSRTTDIAAMELLLNQSVVASDPVSVWAALNPVF